MTLKEIYNAIHNKLEDTNLQYVGMFNDDTLDEIKKGTINRGCYAVNILSAEVSSVNISYRIKSQSRNVAVYYACSMQMATNGEYLDDIEMIFSTLHSLRVNNDTLQPKDFKLLNDDGVLVYTLNFTL